jgi:hypothetical protein
VDHDSFFRKKLRDGRRLVLFFYSVKIFVEKKSSNPSLFHDKFSRKRKAANLLTFAKNIREKEE